MLKLAREIVEFVKYKRQKVNNLPENDMEQSSSPGGEEVETPKPNQGSGSDTQNDQEGEGQGEGEGGGQDEGEGGELSKSMEAPEGGGNGVDPSNQHRESNEL